MASSLSTFYPISSHKTQTLNLTSSFLSSIPLSSNSNISLQFRCNKQQQPRTQLHKSPFTVFAMAPPKPAGKAKKVTGIIKLALEAGKATPAPPVGPALGSKGVNIMAFCKDYNARTADKAGYVIPVEITVYDDKSFTFILKTPPASVLLLKAAEMAQPETSTFAAFKSHLEKAKLTGKNFNDWHRSLRIVLRSTGKLSYLTDPVPEEPTGPDATQEQKDEWAVQMAKFNEVGCLMLQSMDPIMQKRFEFYFPHNMIAELKQQYEKPAEVELYEALDKLHSCTHGDGKPVEDYVNEMKDAFDQLHRVGFGYPPNVQIHLINRSLNKDFAVFVQNFNMHCSGKTVSELLALLVDYEKHLPKQGKGPTPSVLTVYGGKIQKKSHVNKGKGKADKGKQVLAYQQNPKAAQQPPLPKKPKVNPPKKKEQACHHCHQVGHWKRNCALYIAELRQKKQQYEAGQPGSSTGV